MNSYLTVAEIMEWLYQHPELSWDEQIRGLTELENEHKAEGVSVSQWGHHVEV